MATKKAFPTNSAHTAGIFADLSVDGPVIGTLVAIVDRAKNLPNRKTIGKQDPYCAARLGKEAKKTSTDIRGGQTPKWDQELRFTVHDSADYYQLKVSVFTDDKKTDLIGESWVDLKNIIVPGGGQKDIWQNLTCKGKYAGEIRVEITYYDSRPKPEKAPVKVRHSAAADLDGMPAKQKTPMKRRPLPSDPVTGEAPPVNSAPATPDYHQTPPRHAKQSSHSAHIPSQSPLQSVEYGAPSPSSHYRQQPDSYSQAQPAPSSFSPNESYRQQDSYEATARPYDQHAPQDPRGSHSSLPEVYDGGFRDPRQALPSDDERPPPPPVHRSRHNSQNSFDTSPNKMPMRHDVLRSEAHRNSAPSVPSYPGQPTYRGFDSAPPANQTYQPPDQGPATLRHHSHDGTHEAHYRTMQPTVEDAPDSPTGPAAFRQSSSRRPHPDDVYSSQTSPAPLNLSRSPGASPSHGAVSPMQTPSGYDQVHGHSAPVSPLASRDFSTSPGHGGYNGHNQYASQRHEPEQSHFQSSSNYALPALPASLVPGVDPALSQEITDRIYEERRGEMRYTAPVATPPRGRQQSEPPVSYGQAGGTASPQGYSYGYDRPSRTSYGGAEQHSYPHRQPRQSVSPVPPAEQSHTIRRKSVSPIPPSVEERRSSEVPFSPDSFDAFNPAVASSREGTPMGDMAENGGKIITHDGKEIDPSDHLPVESWAPEPEPKVPSPASDARSRPMPGGAQPMPPSGRKQLRVARQQALPAPSPSAGYNFSSEQAHTPPAPVATGRNRLHKRPNRGSGVPSPAASSPLAPISPDNYQDRQGGSPYTPTRGLPRAQTWDYPTENHSPQQHPPHHGYGPPVPAKVPLALMSGANMGSNDERSLMEEMQSIDIGAGRSRRRGGY